MNMNLALRQVLKGHYFRIRDRVNYKILPVTSKTSTCSVVPQRNFCENVETKKFPQLMEFPPIVLPNFLKFIKNWMYVNFIIRPLFEPEFSLPDFIEASKHAVQVISEALQRSDIGALEGLVENKTLTNLGIAISLLTEAQRQLLSVDKEDILFAFAYQLDVIYGKADKRWVEITMCYYVLRGLKHMLEAGEVPPFTLHFQPEYQEKIYILNYKFIREFTKSVEDSWWVKEVNHFQPHSLMKKKFPTL